MNLYDKHIKILQGLESVFGFNPAEVEQGSADWLVMRAGVITASKADKVVAGAKTDGRATYMAELISAVINCAPHDSQSFKQTEWGHQYEPVARDALGAALGFVQIREIPFMYMDDKMRVGISPDGVFDNTVAEIKAPYDGTNHVKHIAFNATKSEWEWQKQLQIYASGAERHLFCTYDPRVILGNNNLHYSITERDEAKQKTLADAVPQFISDMNKALAKIGVEWGSHWQYIKDNRGNNG